MSEPDDLEEVTEAGDPACWAGLVCAACGAVLSEGHLPTCPEAASLAAAPTATSTDDDGGS